MSDCRRMATADHKPDCPTQAPRRLCMPAPTMPPTCVGCNPPADRELFRRLADEVDAYANREHA